MFSEEFLSQLPEFVRTRLLAGKSMNVRTIYAHFFERTESFSYEGFPIREHHSSDGEVFSLPIKYNPAFSGGFFDIKLNNNSIGYVLTSLLNIDFETVTKIIADLEWEDPQDAYFCTPTNFEEIYNRLLSVSDVFTFYLPDEWREWQYDLMRIDEGVAKAVDALKKYMDFCNNRQLPYNNPFFTFLVSEGYFLIDPSILMPAEKSDHYDNIFDEGRELIDSLDEIYDIFIQGFEPSTSDSNFYLLGREDRLQDIAVVSFNEIIKRGKTIRKCQNCGKYFIPTKRSDTLYCDNPSPLAPEMTCKEYGRRRLWYEKQKEDDIARLSKNTASSKSMLAKRNPDIPEYKKSYDYFKEQRKMWTNAVRSGTKTQDDYYEWLLLMQKQKIIAEALKDNNTEDHHSNQR